MEQNRKKNLKHFRDLDVYEHAFKSAMEIYELTKAFPASEKYSMVDQVRRSSRSVCANLAEAWRKRKYNAVFRNKVTDSMQEASETQCWLEFAKACSYIDETLFRHLDDAYERIIGMLTAMERKAEKFCY
jgi:four helix bundle protein